LTVGGELFENLEEKLMNFSNRFWNYGQLQLKIESVICKEFAFLLLTAHRLQFTISFSRFFDKCQLIGFNYRHFYPPAFWRGGGLASRYCGWLTILTQVLNLFIAVNYLHKSPFQQESSVDLTPLHLLL